MEYKEGMRWNTKKVLDIKGTYIDPSYSIEIKATDTEGATFTWSRLYDQNGRASGEIRYSETVE